MSREQAKIEAVVAKCKGLRRSAVNNGIRELQENGWQAELGYHHVQFDVCGDILKILDETDGRDWTTDVMLATRRPVLVEEAT